MDDKRRSDFEWLYGAEDGDEHTRVFSDDELARMNDAPAPHRSAPPPSSGGYPTPAPQPQVAPRPVPQYRAEVPSTRPAPPPVQTPPPAPAPRKRRRRHPVRNTIVTLVLVWVLFMVGTPLFAWFRGNVVSAAPAGDRPGEQPGTVVLLVGSDAREDLNRDERARLGTGSTAGRRTDTMILLYLPPEGPSALISLPRDSWVSIPGRGENKLNAAYAYGGPELLVKTIETNTGVRIDGYLEIGLMGLVETVDAVGGIEVCLDAPIKDRDSHLDLPAGCQELDGVNALNYARMRKADKTGDLGRMKRQREVIGKVTKKALSPTAWLNPVTYWKLNNAVASSVVRSDQTGLTMVPGIASGFASATFGSGYSLTVPVAKANARRGNQSVMLWDKKAADELFNGIRTGDTSVLERYGR